MPKPYKFRELIRALRKHDPKFEAYTGKGSERVIYHPDINGRAESIPVKCHGEGTELGPGVISDVVRRFRLPQGVL